MSTTQVGQGLEAHGVQTSKPVHFNLSAAALYEHAIRRQEGQLAQEGPLVCRTGAHTGRSPNDKFTVKEPSSEGSIWWGKVNKPIEPAQFDLLRKDIIAHLKSQELFVQDLYAGADPEYRLPVRFIHELAWQNLFVRNLFIVPPAADLAGFQPQFTVMTAPSFKADPARHGTRSDVGIVVNLASREVLICGTSYAGENKKSIFSVLNYLLPLRGVLSMHCSANIGEGGDTALFFGLSGTGKTTLSSDPERQLIGDDEHGWSDRRRVQLRRRLLREDDSPVGRSRAADLCDHPALRHRARERGDGSGDAPAEFRRCVADREHARRVSDRVHRQRRAVRQRRSSARRS